MAPFAKIYTYPGNFRVQRAQVLAALNGLEVTEAEGFKMRETNQSPEFLAKFPMGKVPAMECADGYCIAEGVAMCTYIARSGPLASQLLGTDDPKTFGRISEWTCFADNEIVGNMMAPAGMAVFKIYPLDQAKYDAGMAGLERAIKRLEVGLQGGKKFLVGDKITMADVMVGGALFFAMKALVDTEMRKDTPNAVEYMKSLSASEPFKGVFGDLVMCDTRAKP